MPDIFPDLTSTLHQLATEFRLLADASNMEVVGDDAKGLAAYPPGWDQRIMLSAHADTVACAPGYDDRAGIAVMFDLMTTEPTRFAYSIFMDEEIGANGSRTIVLPVLPHLFVGLDRRGIDQVAFYDDESRADWARWVRRNGGDSVHGSFTDCANLGRRYNRCCLNFSVGFNSEHSPQETFDPRGAAFARRMALRL